MNFNEAKLLVEKLWRVVELERENALLRAELAKLKGEDQPSGNIRNKATGEKESRAKYLKKVATATPVPVEGASDGGEQGTQEDTFESLVNAEMAAGKTKGQAIHVVANDHPELHKQWLARIVFGVPYKAPNPFCS